MKKLFLTLIMLVAFSSLAFAVPCKHWGAKGAEQGTFDANGTYTVVASNFVNSGYGNCVSYFSAAPATLTCSDLDANWDKTIVVTAHFTDGTSETQNSKVHFNHTNFSITCNSGLTFTLDENGSVLLNAADFINSSSNACGSITWSVSPTQLTSAGDNQMVILTGTDGRNDVARCTTYVSVGAYVPLNVGPTAIASDDFNVYLDANGNATITVADVNNGSFDPDNDPLTMTISPSSFTCADIGLEPIMVTLSVSDGEFTSEAYTYVTVIDNIKPTITTPANISVNNDANNCGAVVNFTVTSSDNCSSTLTVSPASGSNFPVGTTTVNCSAVDPSGNTQTSSFTVTVIDNTKPTITTPANISVNNDANTCGAIVNFTVSSSDNCSSTLTVSPASGSTFPVGTTSVNCSAVDPSGNTQTSSFTVTVTDNEAPVFGTISDITVYNDKDVCGATVALATPNASDNCGILPIDPKATAFYPVGTTTVYWTVTDIHGNSTTASQAITVIDNQLPTITAPANVTVNTDPNVCTTALANVNLGTPTTWDNCEIASTTNNAPNTFNKGTTTVTWTTTDIHGNTASATQTVTVEDHQAPTLTVSLSPSRLWPPNHKMSTINATVTATDNCSSIGNGLNVVLLSVTSNEADNGLGDGDTPNDIQGTSYNTYDTQFSLRAERAGNGTGRTYTVVYKATDAANNQTTSTTTVLVPRNQPRDGDFAFETEAAAFEIYNIAPNPSTGFASITFGVANEGSTTVSVYNQLGSLVKVLSNSTMDKGVYSVNWDGRDASGAEVSNGVYIIRINNSGESIVKQLIISK